MSTKIRNKIAIIGASYLQLPLVEEANKMGLETHCFAWEEGGICKGFCTAFYPISILEKELILEKCRAIGIDAVCSIASDAAVPTLAFLADKLGLPSNTIECARLCTHKFLMRTCLKEADLLAPDFHCIQEGDSIPKFKHFPLIVKPVDRSGSKGVCLVEREENLESAIDQALEFSFCGQVIVESYIEGRELSVETISWKGEHFVLAFTDKVTTDAPYFVELEHHQPAKLAREQETEIHRLVIQALDALKIKQGASHTELRINAQGEIYILEVGARMGGDFIGADLVYLSTGYNFLEAVIQIALGSFTKPELKYQKASGIYYLSEETAWLMPYIETPTLLPEIRKTQLLQTGLVPIKQSADRSGFLIYQADKKLEINA